MDQRLGIVHLRGHTRRGKQFGVAAAVVAQRVLARNRDIRRRRAPVPIVLRPSIFDRAGVGVFGRQSVIYRHHHRARPDRVVARIAVVGVEVADRPSATLQEDDHRQRSLADGRRPVHPDRDRACRSVDVRSSVRTSG